LYNGVTYAQGAEYPAIDGCNECECLNALSVCSTLVCAAGPGLLISWFSCVWGLMSHFT